MSLPSCPGCIGVRTQYCLDQVASLFWFSLPWLFIRPTKKYQVKVAGRCQYGVEVLLEETGAADLARSSLPKPAVNSVKLMAMLAVWDATVALMGVNLEQP